MRQLLAHAAHLGVTVHVAHLPEPYRGFYDHERRRVVYDFRLAPIERRCVLAHELGHAFHGHRGRDAPAAEPAADSYAAALLIDARRYATLETMGMGPTEIAEELGVTLKLLRAFTDTHLTRVRGAVYARPRLGQRPDLDTARRAS